MQANPRNILLGSAFLLGLALLLLLGKSAIRDSLADGGMQQALRQGLHNAQLGLGEKGGINHAVDSLLDRRAAALLPGENRPPGTPAPGGLLDGQAAAVAAASGSAAHGARDAKLDPIRIQERERGRRAQYGASPRRQAGGGGTYAAVRYAPPNEAAVAAAMQAFLNRVKRSGTQSLGGETAGGMVPDAAPAGSGDRMPILTVDGGIAEDKKTPTIKTLEKLNRQSMHSVNMSVDPGLEDGARDKVGKQFDGNSNDFGVIPIAVIPGAFGKQQIKTVTDEDVDFEERVPNLE